jgi:16S rRNA A1518/A1519 N6-dimethyltransferase RsmA/KsgA/DIM1 with predicted DNA glycosylase/AP lyase activity
LEKAKKVVAVEYDTRMVREVLKRVEGTEHERNLQVIQVSRRGDTRTHNPISLRRHHTYP